MSEDTFRESEDLSKITRQDEINELLCIGNRKLQDKVTTLKELATNLATENKEAALRIATLTAENERLRRLATLLPPTIL